jgi:hypothetical protein
VPFVAANLVVLAAAFALFRGNGALMGAAFLA